MIMKRFILFALAVFTASAAFAQFPNAPNKMRLGAQTTGDGLIYRHAGAPSWTPTGINNAWLSIDTLTGDLYTYRNGTWFLEVKGDLQQVYPVVINKSGVNIKRGEVVSVDTSLLVQGDQIRIMRAIGDGGLSAKLIMGVAATDINNDATGYVAWFGYVREVKQADVAETGVTLNVGDILYLSATEPGRLTNVEPTPPALKSTIALLVRKPNANNLTLLVRPELNEDLSDLNDVDLNGVGNGQTIVWDSINTKWIAGNVGTPIDTSLIATKSYVDSKVDSTRLTQDSILVYYIGGAEVGRDTISGVGGGGTAGVTSITAGVGLTGGTITSTGTIAADTSAVLVSKSFLTNQGYTTNTGTVTGTGTTNTVAKFTSSTAIGNSLITDDGTNVAVGGTASLRLPSGTTAERPGTPLVGMARNNTTNNNLDFYTGTAWENPLKSATATGLGTANRLFYADANGRATGSAKFFVDETNSQVVFSDGNSINANLTTTTTSLLVARNNGTQLRNIASSDLAGPGSYAIFSGIRSRGSITNPTAVQENDFITALLSNAYNGTASGGGTAGLFFIADANATTSAAPQRITFQTSELLNVNRVERMVIKPNGRIGIGTSTPARLFDVNGEVRISDLTTDPPTRIVGADSDGDLGAITVGSGLTLSGGTLTASAQAGTTNLTFSGASSPVTLNSDTGTDVTLTAGTGVTFSQSSNNLTISASAPTRQIASFTSSGGQVVLSQFDNEIADNDLTGTHTGYATSDFVADSSYVRYTGTDTIYVRLTAQISFLSNAVSNLIIGIGVDPGFNTITETAVYFRTATSGQHSLPVLSHIYQCAPNTKFYLNVENTTNNTITLDTFYNIQVEKIN